jgi:hypothetical protein
MVGSTPVVAVLDHLDDYQLIPLPMGLANIVWQTVLQVVAYPEPSQLLRRNF